MYTSCRKNPKFEWFVDSLYNQIVEESFDLSKIELILVDFELQYDESRRETMSQIVNNRFKFTHVEPMPSPWQGKHRLSSRDCFSASLARNTGVCYASNDYIFFVDDLCVLEPGSFKSMVEYASKKIVVAFGYKKVWDLEVENGVVIHKRETPAGTDPRLYQGSDFRQIGGTQLYGYNGTPLEYILRINGFDEKHNGVGYEDLDYGHRLEKCGIPIYYSSKVMFYESENLADQGNCFLRRDPLITADEYQALMLKYNIPKRLDPNGRTDISNLFVDMLLMRNKSWTEGNNYILKELRKQIQAGGKFQTDFDKDVKTLDGVFLRDI